MRLKIENWMRYAYDKPVGFSTHVVRLYPRTDQSIVTHRHRTSINLESDIQYRRDLFDNLVANCVLPKQGEVLEIRVELELELWPKNPFHFLLAPHAVQLPFQYTQEEERILAPYRIINPEEQAETDQIWRLDKKRDTVSALVELASTLNSEIAYEVRIEGDARMPAETIGLRSGACRDTSLLCATILRKIGLAVRLVSGFLCEFHVDVKHRRAESGLHAWIEVYLPGAGWIGIDPTNGTFCDHRFISTAVGIQMQDVAPVQGSFFGTATGHFDSHLDLSFLTEKEHSKIAARVEKTFDDEGIVLTMGGEPTFIAEKPEGPEWNSAAVGPTKLDYAFAFAEKVIEALYPEALTLYSPGKLYPGEVNPRWALHVLRSSSEMFTAGDPNKENQPADNKILKALREQLVRKLSLGDHWFRARDPRDPKKQVWVLPLDWRDDKWVSEKWDFRRFDLLPAEGPAGLRLPLHLLPAEATKRSLVLESHEHHLTVFLPPLLTEPWEKLIQAIAKIVAGQCTTRWEGYVPVDLPPDWSRLGFTADPGVLEVNLPPCKTWLEFQEWLARLEELSQSIGLRTFRTQPAFAGTGGGCHILFGGITIEQNPFFSRPQWLASVLRFWQHHPSLSYLFTGCYVGTSSQAPRPDESGNALLDLELAYRQLENLPEGDSRQEIHELLRHLHTDVSGNTHRSETSFDKFWSSPNGFFGLIEFRAIESLPSADWTAAVALLWRALLAYLLKHPFREPLKDFSFALHDKYFLPTPIWADFTGVLSELAEFGFALDPAVFREIWEWRFPAMLKHQGFTVRKALEGWPLLAETPMVGGTTSRFVDTSIERLEICATSDFQQQHAIYVNEREIPLRSLSPKEWIAGLRYRKSALYPSLHPQIAGQLPLSLWLLNRETDKIEKKYTLPADRTEFVEEPPSDFKAGKPCEPSTPGMYTCDLRIEGTIFPS
jgi:uncharacterized protein (DUF2126 family)/transglutaminase-like putative cysteine protease